MGMGSSPTGTTVIGDIEGSSTVTLTSNQIPVHNHAITSQVVAPGGAAEHAATPPSGGSSDHPTPMGFTRRRQQSMRRFHPPLSAQPGVRSRTTTCSPI